MSCASPIPGRFAQQLLYLIEIRDNFLVPRAFFRVQGSLLRYGAIAQLGERYDGIKAVSQTLTSKGLE